MGLVNEATYFHLGNIDGDVYIFYRNVYLQLY